MRHYQRKRRSAAIPLHQPIMSRVIIHGERFMFMRWPDAAWLAQVDDMIRSEEGRSAFEPAVRP